MWFKNKPSAWIIFHRLTSWRREESGRTKCGDGGPDSRGHARHAAFMVSPTPHSLTTSLETGKPMTLSDRAVLAKRVAALRHQFGLTTSTTTGDPMGAQSVDYQIVSLLMGDTPPGPAPVEYEGLALALCNVRRKVEGNPLYSLEEFRAARETHSHTVWLAVAKRAEEWFTKNSPGSLTSMYIRDRARLGEE
jgi:hypothetical protein